jgi:hypothetical protein
MDPKTVIAVKFKFSFEDRLRASLVLMRRSPMSLISASIFPLVGLALFVTSLLYEPRVSAVDSALIVACFAFTPFAILFSTYRAHRAQRDLPFHSYEFSSSGLHVATDATDLRQAWKAILEVHERSGSLASVHTAFPFAPSQTRPRCKLSKSSPVTVTLLTSDNSFKA